MWSSFSCERSLVNGSATFRVVCILQIFYVYNALHGARLANFSHFQYVSRLRLRVIRIGVKACTGITLYDELFITSITEKYILSLLRIVLTVVKWSTPGSISYPLAKLMARYTIGLVQHSILYRTYGWGIGNDFHSFSILCRGRVLSLTQLHTLQLRKELLLWLIHFELLQNLIKVCTHRKSYQASWSISIDRDAQYVSSFTEVFLWKTRFKHSFMLSRKFYIISDQQYVIHIYLSERL